MLCNHHLVEQSRRDIAFWIFFGFAVASAVVWLLLGLLPALAMIDGVHDFFHSLRDRWGFVGEIAVGAAQATHSTGSVGQVVGDYVFSVFNLALAIVLIRLRPKDLTARLLAIGLTGTAVAFNLQGHDALQVVPPDWLGKIDAWHINVHLISGLCYMGALLLFPYGHFRSSNRFIEIIRLPVMAVGALVFTVMLLTTTEDHTTGLVIAFGLFVPVAGLGAQIGRFRHPETPEARRQSKLLVWALAIAFLVALPLVLLTARTGGKSHQRTVGYEVTVPEPGIYFFRCDPHPDDMIGYVRVDAAGSASPVIEISARNNKFDKSTFQLAAGERSEILFTNFDTDLHNVAIYRTNEVTDPIFIGSEFSGSESGVIAFRIFRIVLGLIPIALVIGLSRFHLWDVDRVINRTLAYGVLAAAITLVYFGLIVTLGTLIGTGTGFNLAVSVALTAVLAAAFQPLRDRARRLANRLVYGKRATPYEVLSELSHRLGDAYAVDEVIPRLAEAVGEGTGAASTGIWLRVGAGLERAGAWPPAADGQQRLHMTALDREDPDESQRLVAVTHGGEVLGAITVRKPAGERFTPVEDRLLHGVATQAGLVLRNAQLTAELGARLKDLAASRQRLVTAQDAERRRIERDLHDGAQQNLVALSMKVRRAQELSGEDADAAASLLEEVQTDTQRTLETLRDLARGIYPPILADKGLVQALEAISRRAPIDVVVEGAEVGRVAPAIENAVYFCCLEAIQNASKHARGPVDVRLRDRGGVLTFSITDAGPGFDPARTDGGVGLQNMIDRLAAVGGTLEIDSEPGRGTSVRGRVPHGS
ncbi:MAG: histidine kinase [Actinomycetota bacterium]